YQTNNKLETPEQTLLRVTDELRAILLQAVINAPKRNATYADLAEGMMKFSSKPSWKKAIFNEFTTREVLGEKLVLVNASDLKALNLEGCSGTLNSDAYKEAWQKALDEQIVNDIVATRRKGSYFSWT